MKIKWKNLGTGILLAMILSACNSSKESAPTTTLQTDEDKVFYTVGVMFGGKLKDLQLSPKEMDLLVMGLKDSVSGKNPEVDIAQYQVKVRDLFNERMKKNAQDTAKQGTAHLEKFLKEPGAKKTASGLGYKILQEGKGATPKAEDTVEVHYHGTLIDGTVFDSSRERNNTVKFPLNRVIRGWTEGLQLVKEGGKIQLVIPAELAYGEQGAPPKIPGGATLNFEVELIKIVTNEGAPKAEETAAVKKK